MTKTRREILKAIEALSERYPEMRFGQLVVSISNWATQLPDAIWDVDDKELLAAAIEHLEKQDRSQTARAST